LWQAGRDGSFSIGATGVPFAAAIQSLHRSTTNAEAIAPLFFTQMGNMRRVESKRFATREPSPLQRLCVRDSGDKMTSRVL